MSTNGRRRVVVTGVGAVTPLGVGARTLHERWSAGRSGIADGLGRCDEFEPKEHLSVKEVRRSDRFTQLALTAAGEALADAGWDEAPGDPDRSACVIGTGIGGITTIEEQHTIMEERGPDKVSALGIPTLMANAASGVIAMKHDLRGQSFGTVSACAAGAHAIGVAARLISYGDADRALAGGTESTLTPLTLAGFNKMEALSKSGISRPFDRRRDGFVMGEGAGVLVLEAEEAARERGARIPHDLSVVGFDDLPFAQVFDPPLTTIRIDPEALGGESFEVLAALMGGEPEPPGRVLPVELVIRGSTAPPPATHGR
jgi:3-oxoacyl-[acyl-carrier-protein] synthase II